MREQKKEQGITLVALVVTIIILLILAGVTISIALSENGIFEKAKEAVEKYKNAEEDEENVLDSLAEQLENINIDYNDYIGAYVEGYNLEKKTFTILSTTSGVTSNKNADGTKIADNIDESGNQTFETETDMKWRIWDYDENTRKIRIISEKPTSALLTLKGVEGYNNGVWAINEVCKECYSNNKEGVTVTNLKRSDIQEVSNYDYTQYKHEGYGWQDVVNDSSETNGNLIYFGEAKTFNIGKEKYLPKMWEDNDKNWTYEYEKESKTKNGIDKECEIWEEIGSGNGKMNGEKLSEGVSMTFKQSYYAHTYKEDEFQNKNFYDLIGKVENSSTKWECWLAGRYAILRPVYCDFGIQSLSVSSGLITVAGPSLCISFDSNPIRSLALRPIVSIDLNSSNCNITKEEKDGKVTFRLNLK